MPNAVRVPVEDLSGCLRQVLTMRIGQTVKSLRDSVDAATIDYHSTTTVTQTRDAQGPIGLDLKDVLLLGTITGADVLLTGATGSGKTHLAKMAMAALFGKAGYFNKTVTPGMSTADFMDIDFGAISRGEKSLRQAMTGLPMTALPAIVLNEVNRAPELVQSVLIPFLDSDFEVEGVPIPLGVELADGQRYQYRIMTINEGSEYAGVVTLDRAVRDRATIEIPMDLFPPSVEDIRAMFERRTSARLEANGAESRLADVLEVHRAIQHLPLDPLAGEFLVYLHGLGNCIRSQTGSKRGIAFSPALCSGCHQAAAESGICGAVYKPSARALINLQTVARGVAAIRMAKGGSTGVVTLSDVMAAASLVLYSKLTVDPVWIGKHFQGNTWGAVNRVIDVANRRLNLFISSFQDVIEGLAAGMPRMTAEHAVRYQQYVIEKDAWRATWIEAGLPGPRTK